jgi:hypothetical protein
MFFKNKWLYFYIMSLLFSFLVLSDHLLKAPFLNHSVSYLVYKKSLGKLGLYNDFLLRIRLINKITMAIKSYILRHKTICKFKAQTFQYLAYGKLLNYSGVKMDRDFHYYGAHMAVCYVGCCSFLPVTARYLLTSNMRTWRKVFKSVH